MNYLYNGVELPALPDWDKETYPYALITIVTATILGNTSTFIELHLLSDYQMGNNDVGNWAVNSVGAYEEYSCYSPHTEWTLNSSTSSTAPTPAISNIKWANFDVLNEDGTLYLAASDPIPVPTINPAALLSAFFTGQAIR